MLNLESRVAKLEAVLSKVTLSELTDDQLRAHIETLPSRSPAMYEAVIALVLRHPSTLPIIHDDPAYAERQG